MKVLIYTSARGKTITFDDYTDERTEYGSYWVGMCRSCHAKYRGILGGRCDDSGSGVCSVHGCTNEAEWYVDFSADEVEEVEWMDKLSQAIDYVYAHRNDIDPVNDAANIFCENKAEYDKLYLSLRKRFSNLSA